MSRARNCRYLAIRLQQPVERRFPLPLPQKSIQQLGDPKQGLTIFHTTFPPYSPSIEDLQEWGPI